MFWVITVLLLASGLCAWMARDSYRDAAAMQLDRANVGHGIRNSNAPPAIPWQVTWMAHIFVIASAMIGLFAVALSLLCIPTE